MITKELGKIDSVSFGLGDYQGAMLGIHLSFSFDNGGCGYSKSSWDKNIIEHSEYCKWSESDRDKEYSEIMRYVSDLLKDAKVTTVNELKNIPVEVTLDGNTFKSFRILIEVL